VDAIRSVGQGRRSGFMQFVDMDTTVTLSSAALDEQLGQVLPDGLGEPKVTSSSRDGLAGYITTPNGSKSNGS